MCAGFVYVLRAPKWLEVSAGACDPEEQVGHACDAHQDAVPGIPIRLWRGGALNQVVAVDGRGHRRLGQARRDELQHRHLRSSILHRHAVCTRVTSPAGSN